MEMLFNAFPFCRYNKSQLDVKVYKKWMFWIHTIYEQKRSSLSSIAYMMPGIQPTHSFRRTLNSQTQILQLSSWYLQNIPTYVSQEEKWMIQTPLDLLKGMIEYVEIPLTSDAKSVNSHIPSYAWTQLPDVLGWESQGAKQTAKLPWEAPKPLGQLAWIELCAALIKELLLAKIFSFKASSAAFAQAAVIFAIVPIDLSDISI